MVAGIRTPQELDAMKKCMPEPYAELVTNCKILESHYKEMMVQYTVQLSRILSLSNLVFGFCPCIPTCYINFMSKRTSLSLCWNK